MELTIYVATTLMLLLLGLLATSKHRQKIGKEYEIFKRIAKKNKYDLGSRRVGYTLSVYKNGFWMTYAQPFYGWFPTAGKYYHYFYADLPGNVPTIFVNKAIGIKTTQGNERWKKNLAELITNDPAIAKFNNAEIIIGALPFVEPALSIFYTNYRNRVQFIASSVFDESGLSFLVSEDDIKHIDEIYEERLNAIIKDGFGLLEKIAQIAKVEN